jgi:hypothetical protein
MSDKFCILDPLLIITEIKALEIVYLISKMWIFGSAVPEETYQPSGDHD